MHAREIVSSWNDETRAYMTAFKQRAEYDVYRLHHDRLMAELFVYVVNRGDIPEEIRQLVREACTSVGVILGAHKEASVAELCEMRKEEIRLCYLAMDKAEEVSKCR